MYKRQVPYITDYIESASTNYPRTDLATVYANVIADLKEIIANGNLESVSSEKDARGRASVIGAKALLAKVYLAAGWDLQTTVNDAKNGTYTVNKMCIRDRLIHDRSDVETVMNGLKTINGVQEVNQTV